MIRPSVYPPKNPMTMTNPAGTSVELIEDIQVKGAPEKHPDFAPETYTDPILEECYRIKAEISAEFKTQAEFFAYLKAREEGSTIVLEGNPVYFLPKSEGKTFLFFLN